MPQAATLIPALITGGTALAGALGSTEGARTGQYGGTQQQSGTNQFSQGPTFRPEQQQLQQSLYQRLNERLGGPAPDLNPLRALGIDQINRTYSGLTDRLMQQLSSRGFGQSGQVGLNLQQLGLARAGDIGQLESNLYPLALQQQNLNLDQALRYAFQSPGYAGSSSFSNLGQTQGTQMYPGSAWAGGLAGAAASGGILDLLNRFLARDGGG